MMTSLSHSCTKGAKGWGALGRSSCLKRPNAGRPNRRIAEIGLPRPNRPDIPRLHGRRFPKRGLILGRERLIVSVARDDLTWPRVCQKPCREVDHVTDPAYVCATEWTQRNDLHFTDADPDMDAPNLLHAVDLALPFVRNRVSDIHQRLRAVERRFDVTFRMIRNSVEADYLVPHELIHHPASVQDRIAGLRIKRRQAGPDTLVLARVLHVP